MQVNLAHHSANHAVSVNDILPGPTVNQWIEIVLISPVKSSKSVYTHMGLYNIVLPPQPLIAHRAVHCSPACTSLGNTGDVKIQRVEIQGMMVSVVGLFVVGNCFNMCECNVSNMFHEPSYCSLRPSLSTPQQLRTAHQAPCDE